MIKLQVNGTTTNLISSSDMRFEGIISSPSSLWAREIFKTAMIKAIVMKTEDSANSFPGQILNRM